jgi:hypothetical protein
MDGAPAGRKFKRNYSVTAGTEARRMLGDWNELQTAQDKNIRKENFSSGPEKNIDIKQVSMLKLDVSSFVEKLNKQLAKPADKIADKKAPVSDQTKGYEFRIESLIKQIEVRDKEISELKRIMKIYEEKDCDMAEVLNQVAEHLTDNWQAPKRKIIDAYILPKDTKIEFQQFGKKLPENRTKSPNTGTNVQKSDTNVREAEIAARNTATSLNIPTGEKKILIACRQYPEGLRREQLTVLTAYKRSSRDTYIQRLKEKGYLEQTGDRVYISKEGIKALGNNYEPLPTGEKLQSYWLGNLPTGERAILEVLISYYPKTVTRDTLSEETGYMRSSRDTYIQRMTAKEIITIVGRGEVKASENLFN